MRFFWQWCVLCLLILGGVSLVGAQDEQAAYEGQRAAPDFPADIEWVNTNRPLSIEALRGKIIVLDFWTYGCINCIHMIPVMKQLEEKYPNEVVVIGVHSAKFGPSEGQTENIRQIVDRYDIRHPVINDSDFVVWSNFGAQAWPTFAVIDPRGYIVARQSGEIPFEAFDDYISGMIRYYDNLGTNLIDRTPLPTLIENAGDPAGLFQFPGKVMIDAATNRLFIADSNQHRIVIVDLATRMVTAVIGSGQRGFEDGDFASAQFDTPQGIALRNEVLYVADTNNHAIRAIDLTTQTVTTIAGTGVMGRGLMPFDMIVSDLLMFDLRSPWDVTVGADGTLYIAMAGTHQVWQYDFESNTMQAVVGSGREGQKNGELWRSELAQPSGLYYANDVLYIADPESSTVRAANLAAGTLDVIAGTPENNLFDFGDVDGAFGTNRLQHALAVTGDENGILYFADTYNNKIKRYDPATQEVTTLVGLGGNGGYRDGGVEIAQFDEPGGLAYIDGTLYVADTNNHAIRIIDIESKTVSTLQITNPTALQQGSSSVTVVGGNAGKGSTLSVPSTPVKAGAGELVLRYAIPKGFKLNVLAVSTVEVENTEGSVVSFSRDTFTIDDTETYIPVTFIAGTGPLALEATLFYCEAEQEAFCLVDVVTISGEVTVTEDAESSELSVTRTVLPPAEYQAGGLGTTPVDLRGDR